MIITIPQYLIFKKIFQDVCKYNIQVAPKTNDVNLHRIKIESIKEPRARFLAYIVVNNHLHDYLVDMRVSEKHMKEPYDMKSDLSFVPIPGHVEEYWEGIERLALNSYYEVFIDDKEGLSSFVKDLMDTTPIT